MIKRTFYVLFCILSLGFGGLIYVLFRPNAIVSEIVTSLFPFFESLSKTVQDFNCIFIKYYFPDYLWAFSLICGLNAIFNSSKKIHTNALVVLLLGFLWETGQIFDIFSGTGDIIDILMYLAAVVTVVSVEKTYQKGVKK